MRCWFNRLYLLLAIVLCSFVQSDGREFVVYQGQGILAPATENYRNWPLVGRNVVHDIENKNAAIFPGIHLIYQDPVSLRTFKDQGVFPDGTVVLMEVWPLTKQETEGGYSWFPKGSPELLIQVKDRRKYEGEGWAYFRFKDRDKDGGNQAGNPQPKNQCQSCHQASAEKDEVFLQYYPRWGNP